MHIKFLCPYWGMEGIPAREFIEKVVEAGYDGVEVNAPDNANFENELLSGIREHQLAFVAQQWLEPKIETVDDYIKRMETLLLKRADMQPDFINSHTGKDYFSFTDNCRVIEKCFEIEHKTGIKISHETHRGRFNYCAAVTSSFLDRYPNLQLSADFSHWVTVSESFLEDQKDQVEKAIRNTTYIHARVGNTQTPQVTHPFAPENRVYLETFVGWWKRIVQSAQSRGIQKLYICPEFGPWPYMPTVPFSNVPMANQWAINKELMNYLREIL